MVILPIVQSVGEHLEGGPHPKLLVMGAALMCSGAMGLPVRCVCGGGGWWARCCFLCARVCVGGGGG